MSPAALPALEKKRRKKRRKQKRYWRSNDENARGDSEIGTRGEECICSSRPVSSESVDQWISEQSTKVLDVEGMSSSLPPGEACSTA